MFDSAIKFIENLKTRERITIHLNLNILEKLHFRPIQIIKETVKFDLIHGEIYIL